MTSWPTCAAARPEDKGWAMSGAFDLSQLGATLHAPPYRVTSDAMVAYARATNDENFAHLDGTVAPPLCAVVPALKTMAAAKRLVTGLFTLHGSHDILVAAPITPGMTVTVTAQVVGILPTPAGATIVVRGETHDDRGTLLNVQHLVVLAQGYVIGERLGVPAPDHRTQDGITDRPPDAEALQPLDPDQTRRYAEASGDREAYTFDEDAARAKGLAGPIVHGLCTMAFVSRLVVAHGCGGDSRKLRRLAVRFTRPLIMQPGQIVTSRLWQLPEPGRFAATCLDRAGTEVLRHGLAEIA